MSGSVTELFDLASLSSWVYNPGPANKPNPLPNDAGQWVPLSPSAAGGTNPSINNLYGFYAEAFQNQTTGEIVIAIRGTDNVPNYLEDLMLGTQSLIQPILNAVANEATVFAEQVAQANPNATITLTGHSLGGYAAQAAMVNLLSTNILTASAKTALTTVTFNAPGLPPWMLAAGGISPSSYNAYNFNTQGDVIHDFGGVQIGKSVTVAAGPTPAQEWNDFKAGFSLERFGALVGVAAGVANVVKNDFIQAAHTIYNFVGTNPYFNNQPGIFSANPSWGAETASAFFNSNNNIPASPLISVNNIGNFTLSDGSGDSFNVQGSANLDSQATLTVGSGAGLPDVSNIAGLQSELAAEGPAQISPLLFGQVDASLLGDNSLFATLGSSGNNATTTVVGQQAPGLTSGLPGQFGYVSNLTNGIFDFNLPSGHQTTAETIVGGNGQAQLWVTNSSGRTQLKGGSAVSGTANTWMDAYGDLYTFIGTHSSLGTLTITQGLLANNPGDEITIQNFNLSIAQSSQAGFMGIVLPGSLTLTAGATTGTIEPAVSVTGTTAAYTLSVNAPSSAAQTITVTLSGASASAFEAIVGNTLTPINSDGTFNVSLAAGETSVSFGLIVTNGVSGVDTVTMTASLSDPANPNGPPMVSAPLTESFTVPAANPPPQLTALDGQYNANTGVTTYSDPHNDYNDSVVASGAHNDIVGSMDGNNLLLGGSGADTIFAGEGVTTIAGGGGQDVILGYGPDHPGTYQIYEQTQTDVATAIEQGAAPTGSSGRGDVIAVGNGDNTIVGASGNDLILAADGNDVVVMGTGNSLFLGGVEINDTDVATLTNWSWNADPTIGFVFENISFEPYGDYQSSGVQPYNGNWVIGSTLPLGYGNDTIFAGSGNQVVLLTNGNNYVDAGSGNDTISAGMGNNTIVGGSGDDYIRGGGGNTYISAVSGNNTLTGGVGNNTILGGSGNDFISSGPYGQILTQPDGSTVPVNNFPGQTFAVHITAFNELSMAA